MKKYLILLLVMSIFFIPTRIFATDYQLPTLAVVSFENHSKVRVLALENMGLQFLESALAKTGIFTLLDRLTVQKSVEELGFSTASGLVDPSYSIQLGKMLGVRYLATGNLIDITQKITAFKGYGITTKQAAVSVTVGLRVIDAEKGTIFFIDQDIAVQELPLSTQNANISGQIYSVYQNLMKQAILKLVNSLKQRVIATRPEIPKTAKKALITINSTPIGADVEISGIFYGNTPCKLSLEEGKVLEITISLGGYDPWIKKILVTSDLKINAKLNKTIPPVDSSDLNVKVSGTVYYSTTPLSDITVELGSEDFTNPPAFSTKTNILGIFTFFGVSPGNYWLKECHPIQGNIFCRGKSITVGSKDLIRDIYLCKEMTLLSPEKNSVVNTLSPTFCWQGLPEAVEYTFQLNETSDWTLIDFVHNIQSTCYTTSQILQNGVQYTWQIDAIDQNGHDVGTTHSAFQFTVNSD